MAIELPAAVREYFESRNSFDIERSLAQFGDEAVVVDEDLEFRGLAAIRSWIEETQRKYHPTFEPEVAEQGRDALVVATLVSGTFPGSALRIDHAFVVSNGKISRLVIG